MPQLRPPHLLQETRAKASPVRGQMMMFVPDVIKLSSFDKINKNSLFTQPNAYCQFTNLRWSAPTAVAHPHSSLTREHRNLSRKPSLVLLHQPVSFAACISTRS